MAKTHQHSLDSTSLSPPRDEHAEGHRPFLLVLTGPQFGELFDLKVGTAHVIGRVDGCDVLIRDDAVSRCHAKITPGIGEALLEDMGSANGTYVHGERVQSQVVRNGDRIQLGAHTTLKFVFSDALEADYQRRLAEGVLNEPLTGLPNRRHFMTRLSVELASAIRYDRPLALLMVDVDHFKRVNDTHGHLAGDEALKTVARMLAQSIRTEDVVARFGGEEFVAMARETDIVGARALGERIRRAVEDSVSVFEGVEIRVTVSVGVAVTGPQQYQPGQSEQQLVHAADVALRRAKESGRNVVVTVPPLGV
jgi:diguanylate cyclase (GGDEF)-like protein